MMADAPAFAMLELGDIKFLQPIRETNRRFGLLAIVYGMHGIFPDVEYSFKFFNEEKLSIKG
jgi:hypothetical protein